jgi:hypothetical protein
VDSIVYFNTSKTHEKHEFDFLCVFLGDSLWVDISSFYSALEVSLKSCNTLPDGIAIFYPSSKKSDISSYWANNDLKDSFFNRLTKNNVKYTKVFYFVEMNSRELIINESLSCITNFVALNAADISNFYYQGLSELTKKNGVIHIAPAGHTFKHPSNKISKLFIQTRELVSTETELQYVGRGLNLLTPEVKWVDIETIYIDTMGIYPIVKEAVSVSGSLANIESFHSYSSVEDLNVPYNNYLIVISASTSGSMARKLITKGFSASKIITLIDVEKREDTSHVLIDLTSTNIISDINKVDGSETDIELVGEHFSYKAKPAKQITIGVAHKPKHLPDILKNFGITGINGLNHNVIAINKSPLLSLKPEGLHSSHTFNKWLEEELSWSLPAAINTIIYNNDGASEDLAIKTKAFMIKSSDDSDREVLIIDWKDLSKEKLKNCSGVIIVTAFAGDGGTLRQISRDLREYESESIPRHFLTGVGIPQSMESWVRLEQFLVRNATSRFYNFSVWKVLPLGPDNVRNSWLDLNDLAAKVDNFTTSPHSSFNAEQASECYDALTTVISNSHNSLLPSTSGNELKITDGFVFFGSVFDANIESVTQSDTLLTIASVLQTAREHKDPNNCLRPTNYQSVIISPENFLRFNDDILQACILRASLPSELDYSSDQHLSELMSEFLYKVFTRHEHPYGYAALEFAGALAVGKLKLKKDHCNELIEKTLTKTATIDKTLTGFLLATLHKNGTDSYR